MSGTSENYAAAALLAFNALARPSVEYCKANGVDWTATEPASGGIYLAPVRNVGVAQFDFDVDGKIVAVVCPVIDRDGSASPTWRAGFLTGPTGCGRYSVSAPALGLQAAESPFTYFGDRPLHLYRTPLNGFGPAATGPAGSTIGAVRDGRWTCLHRPSRPRMTSMPPR